MKPVSYQSIPSGVNGGYTNPGLERLLNASNVIYCKKCGFSATDPAVFKKHMMEHMGGRFFCFYCNHICFSEAELGDHLKQHTSKYPFNCPHCGQGYMRRLCLIKHIDRLHSKNTNQGPAKPAVAKSISVPVSSALISAPTAEPPPPRPVVRVGVPSVPTPAVPAVRLGKDDQRGQKLQANVAIGTNCNAERVSHLNGLMQHNRALTVSLPDEVNIPAGCLVELVEVKTVNGSKELKLRLISQQGSESVIKDTRTAASQITAPAKLLSSALHHPNTIRPAGAGMCLVNRKQSETKTSNVEHPTVLPMKAAANPANVVTNLKRPVTEIINLDCDTVVPNKISKTITTSVREASSGIRVSQGATVNHNALSLNRGPVLLSSAQHPGGKASNVCQRVVDERPNAAVEHSRSFPTRRLSETNAKKEGFVKLDPRQGILKSNTALNGLKEARVVCLNQQSPQVAKSVRTPAAATPARPPAPVSTKESVTNQTFPPPNTELKSISVKAPPVNNRRSPNLSLHGARDGALSKAKSFPVISSVFSLSEQPAGGQGPIQPLVMALRGIVMDEKPTPGSTTQGQAKLLINSSEASAPAKNDGPLIKEEVPKKEPSDAVKVEVQDNLHCSSVTHAGVHVKKEVKASEIIVAVTKSCPPPLAEAPPVEAPTVEAPPAEAPRAADERKQKPDSADDLSSKFLTISLKRVQIGVWKKNPEGGDKLRISRFKPQGPPAGLGDCTVFYPLPLREDQLVKRPGPNQPVVVLNHPKPRACVQRASDQFTSAGGGETLPKCQILKMRLGKRLGEKYEVMGCTVRIFP